MYVCMYVYICRPLHKADHRRRGSRALSLSLYRQRGRGGERERDGRERGEREKERATSAPSFSFWARISASSVQFLRTYCNTSPTTVHFCQLYSTILLPTCYSTILLPKSSSLSFNQLYSALLNRQMCSRMCRSSKGLGAKVDRCSYTRTQTEPCVGNWWTSGKLYHQIFVPFSKTRLVENCQDVVQSSSRVGSLRWFHFK